MLHRAIPSLLVVAAALGCAPKPGVDPRYRPTASLLEIVAVLRRHVPDDTYRFQAARDHTGRNVYRSSLLRLESLESAHGPALRAGHMDGVIAFAKGRALERLRAYDLAAQQYEYAAERESELRAEALRSADLCDDLQETLSISIDAVEPVGVDADAPIDLPAPSAVLGRFEERVARLEELSRASEGTHHTAVVREEMERADVERANYFVRLRDVTPDGDVRAAGELQRVAMRHEDSKNSSRHLLNLADFYADLSIEYIDRHPPESLTFDPAEFRDLVDSSARLYEMVASRDGSTEKLEAARRLEAFLAFSLSVDRDRFTP
jgi:hypothetical protein